MQGQPLTEASRNPKSPMIQEYNVGATFDRSNLSKSKISREGSIDRDGQRLSDRARCNSRRNSRSSLLEAGTGSD